MKKIFIVLIILIVLAGGGYYYFNAYYTPQTQNTDQNKILTLKSWGVEEVVSPIASYNNNAVWYGLSDGSLMRLDILSQESTEYPLPQISGGNFNKLYWPNSGNDFLAASKTGNKNIFSYFAYDKKEYKVLPDNILNLDWLNDSKRIAVIWKSDNGKVQLVVSNADGTGYKVVRELPWDDLVPKASPTGNNVLMYRANDLPEISKIYSFDIENGQYVELVTVGKNTGVLWSPKGDKFAYTQMAGNDSKVFIYDLAKRTSTPMNVKASIDQVAFSSDGTTLYAVGNEEQQPQKILKINASSGTSQTLHTLSNSDMKAKSIFLVGQTVFYVGTDDSLYSVE